MSALNDAEIADLQAQRARLVGLVTKLQAEITALETSDLDDAGYYEKRTALITQISDHQAELARINAEIKTANIARAERQAEAAQARRNANVAAADNLARAADTRATERAARAAAQAPRRRSTPQPAAESAPARPLTVPLAQAAGIAAPTAPTPKARDLGQTILHFAKGLRRVASAPRHPEHYLSDFIDELDDFIDKQKEHLELRDATATTGENEVAS